MISAADNPVTQRKSHSPEWLFAIGAIALALALSACGRGPQVHNLAGQTMGTSWHVTVVGDGSMSAAEQLQSGVEAVLEAVNASMSTYREDSEISRFNRAPVDEWFDVSTDFYLVLSAALAVGWQSEGAYDVTVGPLVNLWGFGPGGIVDAPPSDDTVTDVLENVGQDKLRVDGEGSRVRKVADVYLDFSSIAKGFAVDQVARYLEGEGVYSYLVEVGGEMRLAGLSPRGDNWRVAIEQPERGGRGIARAIRLRDNAVATSGDYRNFFERDGVRYSHSIDPRTGYPVRHELVSVTVVHPSSMLADAWATALTVLGPKRASAVAQANDLAVYFIQREGEGFASHHTPAFEPFLEQTGAGR